jgi:hypothetical protein
MSYLHIRYSFCHTEEYLDDDAKPEVLEGMSLTQSLAICMFGSTANLEVPEQNIFSHADGASDHDSAGHRSSHKISCCTTPPTSKRGHSSPPLTTSQTVGKLPYVPYQHSKHLNAVLRKNIYTLYLFLIYSPFHSTFHSLQPLRHPLIPLPKKPCLQSGASPSSKSPPNPTSPPSSPPTTSS